MTSSTGTRRIERPQNFEDIAADQIKARAIGSGLSLDVDHERERISRTLVDIGFLPRTGRAKHSSLRVRLCGIRLKGFVRNLDTDERVLHSVVLL